MEGRQTCVSTFLAASEQEGSAPHPELVGERLEVGQKETAHRAVERAQRPIATKTDSLSSNPRPPTWYGNREPIPAGYH